MSEILYPDEKSPVKRRSSIDQFKGILSVYKKGGWAPIVFDYLDGIKCDTIKTHPVVISFGENIGYVFPEAHCTSTHDTFIHFNKAELEQKQLPSCFGGTGEFYDTWTDANAFVNFDDGTALGTSSKIERRIGLSYVLCDESLPPEE